MNTGLKMFSDGLKQFNKIKKEILNICKKYEDNIQYYKDNHEPHVEYYTYSDSVDIIIKFQTGAIPYSCIRDLDVLIGVECNRISCSAGHYVNVIYQIMED